MPERHPSSRKSFWKQQIHWCLSGGALVLCLPWLLALTAFKSNSPNLSVQSPELEPLVTPVPSFSGFPSEIDFLQADPLLAPTPTAAASPVPSPATSHFSAKPHAPAVQRPAAAPTRKPSPAASQRSPSPPSPVAQLPGIPLRVAIAIEADHLTLGGATPITILNGQGQRVGQLAALSPVSVLPHPQGIQVDNQQVSGSVVWLRPTQADGLIYVQGHWYRGTVQLLLQGESLLAVNHVDLESYLYSVVGAEMPAYWSLEALKAQAIAARSYALVHISRPANQFYDLGATTRWQAYNGVESETNTTHRAVNETRGLLVSYQGGVVESLYAASDRLIVEAHGGFGMSQEGAQKLAQQSYNFQQILNHFYPGTQLARLEITQ